MFETGRWRTPEVEMAPVAVFKLGRRDPGAPGSPVVVALARRSVANKKCMGGGLTPND
jgi:hypothetical protein